MPISLDQFRMANCCKLTVRAWEIAKLAHFPRFICAASIAFPMKYAQISPFYWLWQYNLPFVLAAYMHMFRLALAAATWMVWCGLLLLTMAHPHEIQSKHLDAPKVPSKFYTPKCIVCVYGSLCIVIYQHITTRWKNVFTCRLPHIG